MDKILNESVLINPLKRIYHPKGDLFHAMKKSDPGFFGFGEAYFTTIHQGETKGWKRHNRMYMNLIIPVGMVRFYIHDDRNSSTISYDMGGDNYARLSVSPGLWMAFHGLSSGLNLILNISSIEHDPEEADNCPLDSFVIK
jgi:dTDP-4-dehydrorhamnose 3,5-epimerase